MLSHLLLQRVPEKSTTTTTKSTRKRNNNNYKEYQKKKQQLQRVPEKETTTVDQKRTNTILHVSNVCQCGRINFEIKWVLSNTKDSMGVFVNMEIMVFRKKKVEH